MKQSNKFIPVNTPILSGNEKKYLNECIDTGWISSEGPFVKKFEDAFAEYVGCNHGIAVANGSAALDVALKALKLSSNDEVIMPTFTIISPAFSVIKTGATPVLIDCDPLTWNMDVNSIEKKITNKTPIELLVIRFNRLPHPRRCDALNGAMRNHRFCCRNSCRSKDCYMQGQDRTLIQII